MRRTIRRLPIPQNEFGFAPNTFNLFLDTAQDGERITRERAESDKARALAGQAQARLFARKEHTR